jgi:uncharacterized protein YbaR (Trm112 family)
MLKCPVCRRQIKVHHGTFACPWCNEKLDWPEASRLEESAVVVIAFLIVPLLVAYLLGGRGVNVLLYGLVLFLPLGSAVAVAMGLLRGTLFPRKLRRHVAGWPDEGTILHITDPPGPPSSE